jgi:hypothetical protein
VSGQQIAGDVPVPVYVPAEVYEKNITHFSIETAGHFDLDAELKIWISGSPMPIQKRFNKQLNIYHVQSILAGYVLG